MEGEIIRVLDKGIILQLEHDVEGIIPNNRLSKRDRKTMARNYKPGTVISAVVMEVKPEDKKVILFAEDLSVDEKSQKSDDVSVYLDNQEKPAAEKIEFAELLEDDAEKTAPAEPEKTAEATADEPEAAKAEEAEAAEPEKAEAAEPDEKDTEAAE